MGSAGLSLYELEGGSITRESGDILVTGASVTCCGNAASPDLQLTLCFFILRAVRLIGIESVACPRHRRLPRGFRGPGNKKAAHAAAVR